MEQRRSKFYILIICASLVLVAVIAYEPIRKNDFVSYDDEVYVINNPDINGGISPESIFWAFTNQHVNTWHPLTSISHMLDCQLFGLDPFRHHLTNLLFHIANTLLLFWILRRMTGGIWRSAFVAAVFAVHPLNVETVAWVAERKNILSGFFWMFTIAVYIRYAERRSAGRLLLVFLVYGLAILTKPTVVSLPFVLLLLDYWPLGRFQWGRQGEAAHLPQDESAELGGQKLSAWHLIREKIPLFILAAVLSVVTFITQHSVIAIRGKLPISSRIANAAVSYVSYIVKMVNPTRLAVLYPHPYENLLAWQPVVSILILAGISAGIVYKFRGHRYLTVGWLWYLGVLVPVIGLVQVGVQSMADRYAYLPLIGIFIIVSWGAGEIFGKVAYQRVGLGVSAGLLLVIFSLCTRTQLGYWRNSIALYERALAVTEKNPIMHNNLGTELRAGNRVDEAIGHFRKALLFDPLYPEAHNNLGLAYIEKNDPESALRYFKRAAQLKPESLFAVNIGLALKEQGKVDEAIKQWEELLDANPDCVKAHYSVAVAMTELDEFDKAIEHFTDAVRIDPSRADIHNNLGVVLFKNNRIDEAIEAFKKAVSLRPDYAEAHSNLAEAVYKQGNVDRAIDLWTEALRLEPNRPEVYNNLAVAFSRQGNIDEAIAHWTSALRLRPGWPEVRRNLNKLIERKERDEEIAQYTETLKQYPDDPNVHNKLAEAFYVSGKIGEAIRYWTEAVLFKPDWAEARNNLATAFYRQGKTGQAIKHWTEAVELRPNWAEVRNNLAWALATIEDEELRNPDEAVELAERACELTDYNRPGMLDTLGVAYAAAGRFAEAVEAAEKAFKLAQDAERKKMAEDIGSRLELYKANKPYIYSD